MLWKSIVNLTLCSTLQRNKRYCNCSGNSGRVKITKFIAFFGPARNLFFGFTTLSLPSSTTAMNCCLVFFFFFFASTKKNRKWRIENVFVCEHDPIYLFLSSYHAMLSCAQWKVSLFFLTVYKLLHLNSVISDARMPLLPEMCSFRTTILFHRISHCFRAWVCKVVSVCVEIMAF
jgi:hypothetical protein